MKVWIIEEATIRGREPESNIVWVSDSFISCAGWLHDHYLPTRARDEVYVHDSVEMVVSPYGSDFVDDRQIRIVADNGDAWFVTCHEVV